MSPWVELAWCGLLLLLALRPVRPVLLLALITGVGSRLYYVLYTMPTLWMLSGIAWVIVIAFYVMTALWAVYLIQLWRAKPVRKFAAVMARGAFLESAALLNSAAGLVITLMMGEAPRVWFAPVMGLVFSVAQIVYFFRVSKEGL